LGLHFGYKPVRKPRVAKILRLITGAVVWIQAFHSNPYDIEVKDIAVLTYPEDVAVRLLTVQGKIRKPMMDGCTS
jgi:hypothetical protein